MDIRKRTNWLTDREKADRVRVMLCPNLTIFLLQVALVLTSVGVGIAIGYALFH